MLSTLATMTSPGSLVTLDIALRGAAIALFLVIALATLRRGHGRPAAWLGALLATGAAAYAVCSSPGPHGNPPLWFAPVLMLCTGNAAIFWLFARALFDDSFRLKPWHALVWLGLAVWPVAHLFGAGFTGHWLVGVMVRVAVILLALLALVQTVRGWGSDLVEGRRRLRLFILIAVALHIAVTVTVELVFGHDHMPIGLHLLNSAALVAIAAIIAVMITGLVRTFTALIIACPRSSIVLACLWNSEMRITPFWTQIPNKAMNPTPAEIPKFIPVTCNARIPPMSANGTLINTYAASFALLNIMNNKMKIRTKLIGTTCDRR